MQVCEHLLLGQVLVQPAAPLHELDPHHVLDLPAQRDTLAEKPLPRVPGVAGMHHSGNVHRAVPHLAQVRHPKRPAQAAARTGVCFLLLLLPASRAVLLFLCATGTSHAMLLWDQALV